MNKVKEQLIDIAQQNTSNIDTTLDKVGMQQIEALGQIAYDNEIRKQEISLDIFVNLADKKTKGIHMSRLFLNAQERLENEVLTPKLIHDILQKGIESHQDISNKSFLNIRFSLLTKRKALVSNNQGWRSYPVELQASLVNGIFSLKIEFKVVYSSTCPCSAALARQLIQQEFLKQNESKTTFLKEDIFDWLGKESSIIATPHSQRSIATIKLIDNEKMSSLNLFPYINMVENSLQTPVQAAVKREDEQQFALNNGKNLMFCEDAARKIKQVLAQKNFSNFWIKVEHLESLHPHDAVAYASKDSM